METVEDRSNLYRVSGRTTHAERPGFRINEVKLSSTQIVPWHYHHHVQDSFYVLEGKLKLHLRNPDEELILEPCGTYSVAACRPHKVSNAGAGDLIFLVLQGIGHYDFVPLTDG